MSGLGCLVLRVTGQKRRAAAHRAQRGLLALFLFPSFCARHNNELAVAVPQRTLVVVEELLEGRDVGVVRRLHLGVGGLAWGGAGRRRAAQGGSRGSPKTRSIGRRFGTKPNDPEYRGSATPYLLLRVQRKPLALAACWAGETSYRSTVPNA